MPILHEGIAALLQTQALEFTARPSEIIAQIAEDYKLTTGDKGQAKQALTAYGDHEVGFRNLFGIINAVTRTAQLGNPAEQFRLEAIGGELAQLDQRGWNRLNTVAEAMKVEKRDKIYGRVTAS